jgi:hypothetical protein
VAGWLNAVLGAGLVIEAIAEPRADEETAAANAQVADTRVAPYFLIVRARKPWDRATATGAVVRLGAIP